MSAHGTRARHTGGCRCGFCVQAASDYASAHRIPQPPPSPLPSPLVVALCDILLAHGVRPPPDAMLRTLAEAIAERLPACTRCADTERRLGQAAADADAYYAVVEAAAAGDRRAREWASEIVGAA